MSAPAWQDLALRAADGHALAARCCTPAGPVRGDLVVAGATGVPQRFYRGFAEHAAGAGWRVWTLDYRGIGESRQGPLRGFEMRYLDWARLDLEALVQAVPAEHGRPLAMVGHSFGGHAFGLLESHARVGRFVTFGTGAGWSGWMPRAERLRVETMWRLIGPWLVRRHGYLAWSRLGMGEDLPLGVYREWRHWCRYPRYFFDDPAEGPALAERFAAVRTPIAAVNALDDRWAPPRSRDAFMAGYRGTRWQSVDLRARDSGVGGPVGHMGYFRSAARPLWTRTLDWLARDPGDTIPF